jgi:hypothetical protein
LTLLTLHNVPEGRMAVKGITTSFWNHSTFGLSINDSFNLAQECIKFIDEII